MINRSLTRCAILALSLGACAPDTLDAEEFALERCTADADWRTRCGMPLYHSSIDRCTMDGQVQCFAANVRPDLTGPMIACLNELSCDYFNTDACLSTEFLGAEPTGTALAYQERCDALSCAGAVGRCNYEWLRDEVLEMADRCLDGPCDELGDCLDAILDEC